jgi:hypothetical protein
VQTDEFADVGFVFDDEHSRRGASSHVLFTLVHATFIDIPSNETKETGHMTLITKRAVLATVAAGALALGATTAQRVSLRIRTRWPSV